MEPKKVNFKNLNYITIVAMFMIVVIHYFNTFSQFLVENSIGYYLSLFLRGFALPAVVIYLSNTAVTSFYLGKNNNYKSLLIYLIIPTLLFQQFSFYMFDSVRPSFDFAEGFSGSWFGEMYVYITILIPFMYFWDKKSALSRMILLIGAVICVGLGYHTSIETNSATILAQGLKMTFPYAGLVYVLYRIISIIINHLEQIKHSVGLKSGVWLVTISLLVAQMTAYAGLIDPKTIITSYFSPFTIGLAIGIWTLIYICDLSKFPAVRVVSQSSYFLYFTHYIMIRSVEKFAPTLPETHFWLTFIFVVIMAYVLSTLIFIGYKFACEKILNL